LIDAARRLIAQKAIEATPIAEITEAADVAVGSFYNHFKSKEELVQAVVESKEELVQAVVADTMEKHGADVDRATAGMSDPAEVLAASVRLTMRKVGSDPIWGWFVVRTNSLIPGLKASLGRRLARDLRKGFRAGRFAAYNEKTMVAAVMQSRLLGDVPADADLHLAKEVLCMLGLRPEEATEIANRPLPEQAEAAVLKTQTA
jgi:AcrR family transcriptional regulator